MLDFTCRSVLEGQWAAQNQQWRFRIAVLAFFPFKFPEGLTQQTSSFYHAGLCKAMPEMISLSYRRDEDNQELQGKYAPQKKTIHPKQFPMFSCRKLRNLDLR